MINKKGFGIQAPVFDACTTQDFLTKIVASLRVSRASLFSCHYNHFHHKHERIDAAAQKDPKMTLPEIADTNWNCWHHNLLLLARSIDIKGVWKSRTFPVLFLFIVHCSRFDFQGRVCFSEIVFSTLSPWISYFYVALPIETEFIQCASFKQDWARQRLSYFQLKDRETKE